MGRRQFSASAPFVCDISCRHGTKSVVTRLICHSHVIRGQIQMNGIIYLVGLVVVILAVLSFFGLR
jgi:hypothetical protein